MANLTKEERQKRELEEKEKIKKEIEAEVRSELSDGEKTIAEENEELKKQLSEMMKFIQSLQSNVATSADQVIEKKDNLNDANEIDMNTRISITSITTGGVNLKTAIDGTARHFRLEKLGQTIPIIYEHLINCINTDRWLFEDGLVYINNAKVVKEQYLEDFYQKFLTPDKIENILNFDIETIKNMVSGTTTAIQETIASLVATKINKGETIDMNKVEVIGKVCNPVIDIRDLANKLR